jgi:ribosomal protein L24
MKITSDGLLLVSYCFNEIELPKTSFSPHEIIELNRAGDDNYNILKREERNIRMGANLHLNDMVQIIAGELKGCYGRIEQVQTRLVKIKCENKETRGLVLEEISDNVVRLFKEGDSVIVTDGISKGEIGTVFKNGVHCIKILTSNNERLKVNKRDV